MIEITQIVVLSYLLGSIPFGVVLAKLFHLPDPRYIGSGNIGATNMLRTGRKDVAALTLLLDAGKGAASVLLAYHLFAAPPLAQGLALLVAAAGHMYSPWLKFKGGKGMATILGAALALSWPVGMSVIVIWLLTLFITQYVSLASMLSLAVMPLIAWLRVDGSTAVMLAVASSIAIWRHRDNIGRLRRGFEPKIMIGRSV